MNAPLRFPALAPRDRRALFIGAALVVPVIFTTVVIRPSMHSVARQRAAVERERELLAMERALVADAPRDRVLLADARRAVDEAAPRLFGGSDAVTASAELARYAGDLVTENGLILEQTESVLDDHGTDPARATGQHLRSGPLDTPLRVTVRAHGDAQSIVDFLQSVESGSRLVRVERLAIARGPESARPDLVTGALSFTASLTGIARSSLLDAQHGTDDARIEARLPSGRSAP